MLSAPWQGAEVAHPTDKAYRIQDTYTGPARRRFDPDMRRDSTSRLGVMLCIYLLLHHHGARE